VELVNFHNFTLRFRIQIQITIGKDNSDRIENHADVVSFHSTILGGGGALVIASSSLPCRIVILFVLVCKGNGIKLWEIN
jgi:hypothetical protein